MPDYNFTFEDKSYNFAFEAKSYELQVNAAIASAVLSVNGEVGAVEVKTMLARGIAAEDVSALKVLAGVDGGYAVADPTDTAHAGAVAGVAVTAANIGGVVTLATAGLITDESWNWSFGIPVYLGIGGTLTQIPVSGLAFVQQIGIPAASNRLLIRVQQPIIIGD